MLRKVRSAVDSATAQWGPQATREQLMMTAMEEMARATDDTTARAYQKQIKSALNEVLDLYPREEYDGRREFPQRGLTVPAEKTARTFDDAEQRERINQLSKHGIPLKLTTVEPRPEPAEGDTTPPDKQMGAVAQLLPLEVGDRVRDRIHPDFTGTVVGFSGESFVRVAMDETSYCEAGSESLYLIDGVVKVAQEPEFEDYEEMERRKRLLRSRLQESKHNLFWDEPEEMP